VTPVHSHSSLIEEDLTPLDSTLLLNWLPISRHLTCLFSPPRPILMFDEPSTKTQFPNNAKPIFFICLVLRLEIPAFLEVHNFAPSMSLALNLKSTTKRQESTRLSISSLRKIAPRFFILLFFVRWRELSDIVWSRTLTGVEPPARLRTTDGKFSPPGFRCRSPSVHIVCSTFPPFRLFCFSREHHRPHSSLQKLVIFPTLT